jgi:hypothetical protein
MTKFGKFRKIGLSGLLFWNIWFWQFQSKAKEKVKFQDSRCFKARERAKRHQGTKIEENQARSQSHKNQTIRFAKPEYLVLPEQIQSK